MAAKKKGPSRTLSSGTSEEEALSFRDAEAWSAWLAEHHASSRGAWIAFAKASASGPASLTYARAVDVALAWGWIDGQKKARDERTWLQRFTPRSARSIWSKVNREKALALIASGAMQAAGLAEVERAKKDGRWERAYDSPRTASVPDDLAAALAKSPRAGAFFATLDSRNRFAILFRLQTAKRAETRAARLATFIAMLSRKERIYP